MRIRGIITRISGTERSTNNRMDKQTYSLTIYNIDTNTTATYSLKANSIYKRFAMKSGEIYDFEISGRKIIQGTLIYESIDDFENNQRTRRKYQLKEISFFRFFNLALLLVFFLIVLYFGFLR